MTHLITFHTAMFDVASERPNPINPIPGEGVLRWFRERLGDAFEVSEPAPEDWGWYVDVEVAGARYLLGASGDADDHGGTHEWILQIHKHRSMMDKLTGANQLTPDDPLTRRIATLIDAEKGFQDVSLEVGAR